MLCTLEKAASCVASVKITSSSGCLFLLLIMQFDNKDTEFVKKKTFISKNQHKPTHKEDTTRSSAQIIMTNTGCNPFYQYTD
ncbi:hypothetical protein T4C_14045 [Trichinella pseudospiralis]|uniref:Uncharacterized protein n=1 Tax=Trichinella pseudospiralis TaxID=6337 RepID=A0A0V1IPQ6_TRIPS|nr:hypothetical protein T4C_14045 [Trichinella pseudospiralis]